MALAEKIYKLSPHPLQTLFLNAYSSILYLERYGKKFWKLSEEFEANQWRPIAELEADQNEKLKKLIQHAYEHVPYYRKKMQLAKLTPKDVQSKADLYKFPLLTKDDIRNNTAALISTKYPKYLLRSGHTSGTTGSPLQFYYDIHTCVVHHVADWRQKYWAGLEYGQPYASLQGRVIVPMSQKKPPFWRKNYLNNQLFLSSFHLHEKNLPYYFEKLRKDKIRFIEGYPSNIYILALYLLKNKETFPLSGILTSSETLFDFQREAIESTFLCPIYDFYGMAERVMFATECEAHEGHHINLDYGMTEILNSDYEPVPVGTPGKMVATSLHNFAMPLIRYETNDVCALKRSTCSCGRSFPLMDDVATKNEAIISLPDGRLISPSVLTHPFKPMHNIAASQIIQESLDLLRIKIVKRPGFSKEDENKLIHAFHERLENQIKIEIEYVDLIPKTSSGKFKWVISKVKPTF